MQLLKINHSQKYLSTHPNLWKSKRKTERQKDRKTERQKDRKTERQKDRKTERQKDRHVITENVINQFMWSSCLVSIHHDIK